MANINSHAQKTWVLIFISALCLTHNRCERLSFIRNAFIGSVESGLVAHERGS